MKHLLLLPLLLLLGSTTLFCQEQFKGKISLGPETKLIAINPLSNGNVIVTSYQNSRKLSSSNGTLFFNLYNDSFQLIKSTPFKIPNEYQFEVFTESDGKIGGILINQLYAPSAGHSENIPSYVTGKEIKVFCYDSEDKIVQSISIPFKQQFYYHSGKGSGNKIMITGHYGNISRITPARYLLIPKTFMPYMLTIDFHGSNPVVKHFELGKRRINQLVQKIEEFAVNDSAKFGMVILSTMKKRLPRLTVKSFKKEREISSVEFTGEKKDLIQLKPFGLSNEKEMLVSVYATPSKGRTLKPSHLQCVLMDNGKKKQSTAIEIAKIQESIELLRKKSYSNYTAYYFDSEDIRSTKTKNHPTIIPIGAIETDSGYLVMLNYLAPVYLNLKRLNATKEGKRNYSGNTSNLGILYVSLDKSGNFKKSWLVERQNKENQDFYYTDVELLFVNHTYLETNFIGPNRFFSNLNRMNGNLVKSSEFTIHLNKEDLSSKNKFFQSAGDGIKFWFGDNYLTYELVEIFASKNGQASEILLFLNRISLSYE